MAKNTSKIVLWIIGFLVLLLIVAEFFRPTPINWSYSYMSSDKIPYGCYVVYQELPEFLQKPIVKSTEDPFVFLTNEAFSENSVFIFINDFFGFDLQQTNALLEFVEEGNTVFLSTKDLFGPLADSLKVSIRYPINVQKSIIEVDYTENSLKTSENTFLEIPDPAYFNEIDSTKTKILSYTKYEKKDFANFVSLNYGSGKFYIHSLPEVFTNYNLLSDSQEFAASALSYLEGNVYYWDEYLKTGKVINTSEMRFILSDSRLKVVYYLLMFGLLLFVVFRGKREQKIIPVIPPVENKTISFTKSVGSLYFHHRNYSNIIAKKIFYFFSSIRTNFLIETQELSDEFIQKLALKSGKDYQKTRELIYYIKELKEKTVHTENDLIELNKKIEYFNSTENYGEY